MPDQSRIRVSIVGGGIGAPLSLLRTDQQGSYPKQAGCLAPLDWQAKGERRSRTISMLRCALSTSHTHSEELRASQIYEAASKFEEIGAGVSIGPNAVEAMRLMGFEDEYLAIADECAKRECWFEWRDYKTNELIGETVSDDGTIGQSSVHRAGFLDQLVKILPPSVRCQFGCRLASYAQNEDGQLKLTFENGQIETCHLLLAFDGIKSAVRRSLYPDRDGVPPRWTGTYAYRGLVPHEKLEAAIGKQLTDIPQMYCGPDSHILTFSIQEQKIINIVAFISDRSQPVGQRYWKESSWVSHVSQEQMLDDFAQWGDVAKNLLKCIDKPSRWALHELEELPSYLDPKTGRVALAGDAAHAMLPHQGAGAGQAIEDAYAFSILLNRPGLTRADIPKTLEIYDRLRRPRACKVQRTSREGGDLYEFADPTAKSNHAEMKRLLESRMNWIWRGIPELNKQLKEELSHL